MENDGTYGISRRVAIKWFSFLACALPLSAIGLPSRLYGQMKKMSKEEAGYLNRPNGKERCSDCANFVRPDACAVVDGTISPQGWCRYWHPR